MPVFIPADGMELGQLLWTAFTYGYVLFQASNLISEGSELLLLIPSVAGLVGGVVLPVLGAVPDGMMVLFSGLSPDPVAAQANLQVGIGALAGSTIMLLTVPWFLAILGGRVDIEDGQCQYKNNPKLTKHGLFDAGISYQPVIRSTAKVMLMTAMTFLVIQVPGFMSDDQKPVTISDLTHEPMLEEITKENKKEVTFCLVGGVICVLEFFLYLYWQYEASRENDGSDQKPSCWSKVMAKLTGASQLPNRRTEADFLANKIMEQGIGLYMKRYREKLEKGKIGQRASYNEKLMTDGNAVDAGFESVMKVFFKKYANLETQDNMIGLTEFTRLVNDLHIDLPQNKIGDTFKAADSSKDGALQFGEFMECFSKLASFPTKESAPAGRFTGPSQVGQKVGVAEEEEEEQEEMPEEFADLPPDVQRKRILMKSCYMMAAGTLLMLVFSDPMVDVLAGIGKATGVPSFYIAFILAPLASNASELVAAYSYSLKKTSKTITISLSTLEGAACMNNTFCLAIFFGLIYCQGLAWKFTAETISILVVQLIMFGIVMMKDTQTLADGVGILMLLPLSLALVYVLENLCLLD